MKSSLTSDPGARSKIRRARTYARHRAYLTTGLRPTPLLERQLDWLEDQGELLDDQHFHQASAAEKDRYWLTSPRS